MFETKLKEKKKWENGHKSKKTTEYTHKKVNSNAKNSEENEHDLICHVYIIAFGTFRLPLILNMKSTINNFWDL